jgi:hypothetical protein
MKKLVIGEPVKEVKAICNFCGEEKDCLRGAFSNKTSYPIFRTNLEMVIKDYYLGGFNQNKRIIKGDWTYKEVIASKEMETKIDYCDICKDCAKQLSKF